MRLHFQCRPKHKSFEGENLPPVTAELRSIVIEASWPAEPGESVKAAIGRAARKLSLSYARTRAYWYDLVKMVPAEEADALRAARRQLRRDRLARLDAEAELLRLQLGDD